MCISIIIISAIPAMGNPTQFLKNDTVPELETRLEPLDDENDNNIIITQGPMFKSYSKVTLLNGTDSEMKLIQRHLDRKLLRPLIIFRNVEIKVVNLSFRVEYKKDAKNNSRFSYKTTNGTLVPNKNVAPQEIVNSTIIKNQKHTVTVENMTGTFTFHRIRLIDLFAPLFRKLFQPARFTFSGTYEKITYS